MHDSAVSLNDYINARLAKQGDASVGIADKTLIVQFHTKAAYGKRHLISGSWNGFTVVPEYVGRIRPAKDA